jgi:hypothetical protein
MDALAVKKQLAGKIDQINDSQVLESLEALVDDLLAKSSGKDFWNDLPESLQRGIEAAEKDLDYGKGIPHKEVAEEIKKRFKN